MATWLDRLRDQSNQYNRKHNINMLSVLRRIVTGSFYKISDLRGNSDFETIVSQINTMRALATDSQIDTALSYYATDATTPNSAGQIIWATAKNPKKQEIESIINTKFLEWNINTYARDHILELATYGNLYLPTTNFYREEGESGTKYVSLDGNTIRNDHFEIIPSSKIPPENIAHLWEQGVPNGFAYVKDQNDPTSVIYDEDSVVHFCLGGLLGDYTISGKNSNGDDVTYDIQFGKPLMAAATQPTQTLNLLEDATVLSSLARTIKFINVECGNAQEEEIQATLQQLKDMVEQQLSLNTSTGDAQSYVNPQSPNNLIYVARVNGQDSISITDLNMAEASDAENKLLEYYQNKKLSVLGIPKEAMNFSSAEGLGGAGAVMSQRSALYANSLQRIETAYMEGWRSAINKYLVAHNLSGYVNEFDLHMNPIITQMSTVMSERRDSALSQATSLADLLKGLGVTDSSTYQKAITEVLTEVLPVTSADVNDWKIDLNAGGGEDAF